ncbi:MAG TPA: SDR family oxidoreductase, partial [Candidatus Methylomirabilis sp.]|nr:SDR family oxidoreductase [Candidatus Methylomirabilis sp.]
AICAQEAPRLAAAEKALTNSGTVFAAIADVGDRRQVNALVESTRRRLGDIDVLVNNAGRLWSGLFAEQPPETIDQVLECNIKGVMNTTRAVLPDMLARGTGVIINVASGAGLTGYAGLASYCASKFAVVGFTESLAQEVITRGVRVYAVCPGAVNTDMQRQYSGTRMGIAPGRVAEKILSLAGPRAPIRSGGCLEIPN